MNIILINTDQQKRDSLSVYGNTIVQTPNIDSITRRGMVFDNAFTTTPICGPARASMLTGLFPSSHGILRNAESGDTGGRDFAEEPFFFNHGLSKRGYRCHHIGKWHVGTALEPGRCGWEGIYYPGYGYPSNHPDYLKYLKSIGTPNSELRDQSFAVYADGNRGPLLSSVQNGGAEVSVPHYLVSKALAAISESNAAENSFFLRCDFWGPHVPYIIPEEYLKMYDPRDIPEPESFADTLEDKPRIQRDMKSYWGVQNHSWEQWSKLVAACYGYVSLMDFEIGRILALLDALQIRDSTAIFFTSDHGGMVGSHGLCDKGPYLYDDIIRIPLIADIPGCPSNVRSDAFVYNMDLCPTFLDLGECEVPERMDAQSILPVVQGSSASVREAAAYVEFYGHQVPVIQKLMRTETGKYIFNSFDKDEYYDLLTDPNELVNLICNTDYQTEIKIARQAMFTRLKEAADPILRYFEGTRMHNVKPANGAVHE
jgi:arylsulfatase A-like enzyme